LVQRAKHCLNIFLSLFGLLAGRANSFWLLLHLTLTLDLKGLSLPSFCYLFSHFLFSIHTGTRIVVLQSSVARLRTCIKLCGVITSWVGRSFGPLAAARAMLTCNLCMPGTNEGSCPGRSYFCSDSPWMLLKIRSRDRCVARQHAVHERRRDSRYPRPLAVWTDLEPTFWITAGGRGYLLS